MARYGQCAVGILPRILVFIAAGTSTLVYAAQVKAEGSETREFLIKIKNKPAGHYRMTISATQDGTVTMTGSAQVEFKQLLVRYTYSYRGTETWQNGRLVQLDSAANDDGKVFAVSARAIDKGLRVQVNGHVHDTRPDVWTTTYWKLADARFRNQSVPLIDADTGRDIVARLQFLGAEAVNVAGEIQRCAHYKLTGGSLQVDLWYDGQERLVRQLSVEQGQPTLLELQSIN